MSDLDLAGLFAATANGDFAVADAIVARGTDINGALDGEYLITRAAQLRSLASLQWLLSRQVELDVRDSDELTALMIACSIGGAKGSQFATKLIQAGCDVSYRRAFDGMSALEFAVKKAEPGVVRLLISKGLPINGHPNCKQTPLMLAARANNIDSLGVLIELGADLKTTCRLPWAMGLTCIELAEKEGCRKAVSFLSRLE